MKATGLPIAVLLLSFARTVAGAEPAEIRWNELATRIAGQEVAIPLEGGTVGGHVLAVRDQSLLLNITKSSDPRRYARGETSLPRTAITEIRVLGKRGKGWRVAGALLGSLVGFVGGMAIGEGLMRSSSNAAANTVLIAVWGGATVGGYFVGRNAERRWQQLRIAPAPAGP